MNALELIDRIKIATTIGEAIDVLTAHYSMSIGLHMNRLLLENNVRERRAVLREAAQTPGLAEALLSQGDD
jgi:hypothetical protein